MRGRFKRDDWNILLKKISYLKGIWVGLGWSVLVEAKIGGRRPTSKSDCAVKPDVPSLLSLVVSEVYVSRNYRVYYFTGLHLSRSIQLTLRDIKVVPMSTKCRKTRW